ncbi:flagellar type III secretion system protein FlhB [Shimia sp. SDUM112013]|uniref:EscU/YscU/HrcU family type III secretion system export apparatus switch protein n=1 Tax=Shimia sp. SDUM112013 TaxID=3136160 RepID=UPI0032EE60B9
MSSEEASEKPFEPTPKKLEDARKKGEIAKSMDVQVACGYAGFWGCLITVGLALISDSAEVLRHPFDDAERFAQQIFQNDTPAALGAWVLEALLAFTPLFVFPAALVLLGLLAQRAIVFTPTKLQPKLSRVDPFKNAKSKFGRSGFFEFGKSFFKLLIYTLCLGVFLQKNFNQTVGLLYTKPNQALVGLGHLVLSFMFIAVIIATAIAAVDFSWQRHEHLRKHRMTQKEVKDETKESEGDAHFKQERRQRAQHIALNQMLGAVPNADVIIVNPTHFAVALEWSRKKHEAPKCVAKGVDEIALKLREVAQEAGVPIHSDPPAARLLYASVEIGNEIQPEHYLAVAAAIRFSDDMRKRARL